MDAKTGVQDYSRLVTLAGIASVSTACAFILAKFVVWILSSSSSIFASMTDSMIDSVASIINLIAIRYSIKPADQQHPYGHYKAQSLASLAQGAFIAASGCLLIAHGAERISTPMQVQHYELALGVSVLSIVVTVMLVLFQGYVYKKTRSEAVGADRFHYLSDVWLNLGVIVALLLSQYGYLWADGLFSVLIGLLIVKGAVSIGSKAMDVLLDKSLSAKDTGIIMEEILKVPGVQSLHGLKTRQAGPQIFIQCDVVMDGQISLNEAHTVANHVKERLEALAPGGDITIHMDPHDDHV
ncbi:MAG: cation diffusion facilitator family transporter [Succinivibrio sp.]|nr:cation diffusion facilitator family transporter [Succinivibrio sp.]